MPGDLAARTPLPEPRPTTSVTFAARPGSPDLTERLEASNAPSSAERMRKAQKIVDKGLVRIVGSALWRATPDTLAIFTPGTITVVHALNRVSVGTECASDAAASGDMPAEGVCDVRSVERSGRCFRDGN